MSWKEGAPRVDTDPGHLRVPHWRWWICDNCGAEFDTLERPPPVVFSFSVRRGDIPLAWLNYWVSAGRRSASVDSKAGAVHYCSLECQRDEKSRRVRYALLKAEYAERHPTDDQES